MKLLIAVLMVMVAAGAVYGQESKAPVTLKSILLDQLRTTHDKKDWFVDGNTAVAGLTAEQASWTDGKGNHSVGQLANHLVFWNKQTLAKFEDKTPTKFDGNNDETFNSFNAKNWAETVQQLDEVMKEWEKAVEAADDNKLEKWAPTIARVGTHNAYHIGQIVFVRKEQGSWDPEKGVK